MMLSIMIPCRNESVFIRTCLSSALSMETNGQDVEIMVIDGGSTDHTREVVDEFRKHDPRVRLLHNPAESTVAALNIGLREAAGEWIVRLDAHAWYERDYLQQCLGVAERTGADAVGGACVTELPNNSASAQLVRAVTTHRFGVGNSSFRTSQREGPTDTVLFGCYRRGVFDSIGLWDERLSAGNEDFEFNQRLAKAGGRLWFSPAIRAHYFNKPRFGSFLLKVLKRDGPCNPWMWYLWPASFRARHSVPLLFVMGLALLTAVSSWSLLPLSVALLSYASLAVVAAAQQALRYRKWWLAGLLPVAFFAYHVAHGLGGLYGLLLLALNRAPVSSGRASTQLRPVRPSEEGVISSPEGSADADSQRIAE